MTLRAPATLAATVFVMAVLQFFSALGGLWFALGAALLLPFVTLNLMRFFEAHLERAWLIAAPVVASAVGILIWALSHPSMDVLFWFCPAASWALMAFVVWWQDRDARRCGLCNSRLAGAVSFACPRCGLNVCDQKCWDFERLRCRLCVQNDRWSRIPAGWPLVGSEFWAGQRNTAFSRSRQTSGKDTELQLSQVRAPAVPRLLGRFERMSSRCKWVTQALPETLKAYM